MYIKYLRYVIRHKWYVLIECFKQGLYWQGLMHDVSKFLPSELIPYARYFYGKKPNSYFEATAKYGCYEAAPYGSLLEDIIEIKFDTAWLNHIHRNPHHWQYWILREDDGGIKLLPMPKKYIQEMLADWHGAGKAQGRADSDYSWYCMHKKQIQLHPATAKAVEEALI